MAETVEKKPATATQSPPLGTATPGTSAGNENSIAEFFRALMQMFQQGGLAGMFGPSSAMPAGSNETTAQINNTQKNLAQAGLYPGPGHKYYQDGIAGDVTEHGLKLANDPEYAKNYMKTALKDDKLDGQDIMKLKATLNRLGYSAGDVDERLDSGAKGALQKYLKENPDVEKSLATERRSEMKPETGITGFVSRTLDKVRDVGHTVAYGSHTAGHAELNPDLVKRMGKDPQVAKYVEMTRDAAARNGIDGNMLANQFWQESRFNPNAKSPAGAEGIAQFMPATGKAYGLDNSAERRDPTQAIEAGAKFMGHLTRKHGSQELALMAYNGGEKSIEFAQKKMGIANPTIENVMAFYHDRRQNSPTAKRGAWQNETYEYVEKITQRKGVDIARGPAPTPPVATAAAKPEVVAQARPASTDVDFSRPVTPTGKGVDGVAPVNTAFTKAANDEQFNQTVASNDAKFDQPKISNGAPAMVPT